LGVDIGASKVIIKCPECSASYTILSKLSFEKDYNNIKCYQCGKIVDMIYIKGTHSVF